jgi:xylulose-5-phosphate/fructose-6-phosphate phosphoketolase
MIVSTTLQPEQLHAVDAYWRAINFLSVGLIYPYDNPLLKRPRALPSVRPLDVAYSGTTSGQNVIDVHLDCAVQRGYRLFGLAGGDGEW